MANDFKVNRAIVWNDVPIAQVASTYSAGQYIPAGAVIVGMKAFCTGAQTNQAAGSATVQFRVGTDPICSAFTVKQLSQTVPLALTLINAGGQVVPNSGELNVIVQASSNSSYVGVPTVFIEYYK